MEADYRFQVIRVRTPGEHVRLIPFAAWLWWDEEERVPTLAEQEKAAAATTAQLEARIGAMANNNQLAQQGDIGQMSALAAGQQQNQNQQLAQQQGQLGGRKGK